MTNEIEHPDYFREAIYKSFFDFIIDENPADNAKENFVRLLKNEFKYRNVNCDDYSFPPQEVMETIEKKYEEEKASIIELFIGGTCLTFNPSQYYTEPSHGFYTQRKEALEGEKNLIFTNAEFPLLQDNILAFFSDGTYLAHKRANMDIFRQFEDIAKKRGYHPKTLQIVNRGYIKKINAYARKIYTNKIAEIGTEPEKEFIKRMFDDAICCTASKDIISYDERKYLALFSNGKFVVSNKFKKNKFNRDLANKVTDFERRVSNVKIIFEAEYVPHQYIEAIYKKAEEFEGFLPIDEVKKIIDINNIKIEDEKAEESKEKREAFIDELFKNNNACLSIVNLDDLYTSERDEYALFENNRFIVNKERDWSAAHREFAHLISKKNGSVLIPEYVPAEYLPAIYERALKTQKSAKDIYIEMLKKKAKKLAKSDNISHTQALEKLATLSGFPNWKRVCEIDEDIARINLGKNKEKEIYVGMIENEAKSLAQKENISLETAKDRHIKSYGFNDWEDMLNVSLETLVSKIKSV